MQKLVECVPNFSEGQRAEVIEEIVETMRLPDVLILDVHRDADHNRSVVTLVGEPNAVQEAMFRGIAKAATLINLDQHRGVHPRLGATDVVPFVPVQHITMDECILLARQLGQRVGENLGIPVYLYEAAATNSARVNLADVRRGGYELLKQEIGVNPNRAPDFGPVRVGSAGATMIGARSFLIAFNAYLNTDKLEIAQKIARAIRESSGGLPHVKALGFLVAGQAQVSMNLTNFEQTSLPQVVEAIRNVAATLNCAIDRTELVGMIPQQALFDAARWYLQLENLTPDLVLENRIYALKEETKKDG